MTTQDKIKALEENLDKVALVQRQPYPLTGIEVRLTGRLKKYEDDGEVTYGVIFDQGYEGTACVCFKVSSIDEVRDGVYNLIIDLK